MIPGEVVDVQLELEEFSNYFVFPSKAVINERYFLYLLPHGRLCL